MPYRLIAPPPASPEVQETPATLGKRYRLVAEPPAEEAASKPPATLADVSKSVGSGLLQGGAYLAGLPGDLRQFADWGVRKAGSALGLPEPPAEVPETLADRLLPGPPTSAQATSAVESVTGPLYQPQSTAGKYAKTIAEFAPGMLTGPGGITRRALQGAVLPGAASEAAGQATEGTVLEPYARMVGALGGAVAPAAARRVITPIPQDPGRQRMVQTLEREGVQPTAGQATGNKRLQYMEAELGGAGTAGLLENQGDQFTAAILRRIGDNNATRATTDVVDRNFRRIGNEFDAVARNNTLVPDNDLINDMSATWAEYTNLVPESSRAPAVRNLLTDILQKAQRGPIPGKVYQTYRSRLDRMARKSRSDPQLSEALGSLRTALDDAMERSMVSAGRTNDIARWQEARRQYRNIIVVEKSLAGGGEQAGLGIITPARLRMAAASGAGRRGFVRGQNEFSDLALAGGAVLTPLPNSGTPSRLRASGLGTTLAGIAGGGVAGVPGAIGGAIAGAAAPYVAGRTLMSGPVQRYLKNTAFGPTATPSEAARRAALLGVLQGPRLLGPPPSQP